MRCINHPEVDAVGKCIGCGSSICDTCRVVSQGEDYCKKCVVEKVEGAEKSQRSPGLAAFLSFIIAGSGQMYNGQIGKGVLILFTSWLIIPWIYGIFNAYSTARKINEGTIVAKKATGCLIGVIIGGFLFFFIMAIIGLLAAIAIPNLLRARHNANEAAAKASIRTIVTACESYKYANNSYPENLETLSAEIPPYIDSQLGAGQKYGYSFTYQRGADGLTFTTTASPIQEGSTGTRTFIGNQDGEILVEEPTIKTLAG